MRTFPATVVSRHYQSRHLVTVTLGVDSVESQEPYHGLDVPDEYVRLLIPQPGHELVLPGNDGADDVDPPSDPNNDPPSDPPNDAVEPVTRVYTVSDHRIVNGQVVIDVDVVLHEHGIAAAWARNCLPGDRVGVTEPRAMYTAPAGIGHHVLVGDITGVPAMARILRDLKPDQTADAAVVVTDAEDQIPLPSVADVATEWIVVDELEQVPAALSDAVSARVGAQREGQYLWFAGEASASRKVRKLLRRELGWTQAEFCTCGYWQLSAERKARTYELYADKIGEQSRAARQAAGDDAAYQDALEDIFESFGL